MMNNVRLQDLLKTQYRKFLVSIVMVFIVSSVVTFLLAIQLEKNKLCERLSLRFQDLNDVLARELVLQSDETLNFELNKLRREFDLESIQKTDFIEGDFSCGLFTSSNKYIFPVRLGESNLASFLANTKSPDLRSAHVLILFIPLVLIISIILISLRALNNLVSESFITPLSGILSQTQSVEVEDVKFTYDGHTSEFIDLTEKLNGMLDRLHFAGQENLALEKAAGLGELATQVAHDIRSPLASLAMLLTNTTEFSEDKRTVLKTSLNRIQDIANSLLSEYRTLRKSEDSIDNSLLAPLIEEIVTEKRNQHRQKHDVVIDFDVGDSFLVSSRLEAGLFKRVISNLIENSVEAVDSNGRISIRIEETEEIVLVYVCDNGPGIPIEIQNSLGSAKVSFGKLKGNGLGVFSSVQILKGWGGDLYFEANVDKGAVAVIKLLRSTPPSWLATQIYLDPKKTIVVIDDESSIHQLWKTRISGINDEITLKDFSNSADAEEFIKNILDMNAFFFLVDYELINSQLTGIELIKKFNLASRSVLVTSRYDQFDILKEAQAIGLKVLPKSYARFIDLRFDTLTSVVLIDDDRLIRLSWEIEAKKKNIKFWAFESVDIFLKTSGIPLDAEIYVDSDLGNGLKGELLAHDIYLKGYRNIYLATGYDEVVLPNYIIQKSGKRFPNR